MPTVHGLPLPPSGVTIDGSEVLWVDKEIGGDWFTYQFTAAEVVASLGGGTVTSVGLSLPAMFTVSNSPVTSSGTLTAVLANQSANRLLAGPASGAAAAPTFRALVWDDIPLASALSGVSGVLGSDLVVVEASGLRFQATVSQLLADAGAGTVTSVGLSLPAMFTVSNSPVTAAGTLTAVLATQAANRIFAGPASGAAAAPTFRAAVGLDLPLISSLSGVSGVASSDLLMAEVGGVLVQATVTQVLAGAQPLDADLTTIAGLTATTDNFMQAKSSAWASRTIAQVAADLQGDGKTTALVGFRGVPSSTHSADYTVVAADAGKCMEHPAADANARTFTIDSVANQSWDAGTAISFKNETSQVLSIAVTAQTLTLAGSTTTGTRSLAQNGMATAHLNAAKTVWLISGTGLT